jgi:hypothetical protein
VRGVLTYVIVLLAIGGFGMAQGTDGELTPLPSTRAMAETLTERVADRIASSPSSLTRDVFRAYRAWLAQLARHGLEEEFVDDVRALSRRMAERIAERYEELVDECRAGNASVSSQMRDLFSWAERYPALVQHLGAGWFERARREYDRCVLPNWYGVATAGQVDAFETGYYGSVAVTWIIDQVDDALVTTYVPVFDHVSFEIPRGECELYTVERAVPNPASFLVVDFGRRPPVYRGTAFIDVDIAITDTCSQPAPPPFRLSSMPMPIMFPLEIGWQVASASGDVIEGAYVDSDTTYQSAWYFSAIEREGADR